MSIQTKAYSLTIAANAVQALDVQGEFYKVTQSTGLVQIRRDGGSALTLQAGQGEENVQFNRLEITNLTAGSITVTVLIGASTFIDDTVTIAQGSALPVEDRGVIGATVSPTSQISGAGVITLITPASNTTGMILENVGAVVSATLGNGGDFSILRKASAPASNTDGSIVTVGWFDVVTASTQYFKAEAKNVNLAAGLGLYVFVGGSGVMNGRAWANARAL